jgi:putative hydrolase of the HAD superfamily
MLNWPRVSAFPGAGEALSALSAEYRLAIVTNAGDSSPEQVKGALQRVGLDAFFLEVYTSAELGARKPNPAFFQGVIARLGVEATQAILLGDSLTDDVNGALEAGLRAVWFNPQAQPCPSSWPQHQAEFTRFSGLPELIAGLARGRPSIQACQEWQIQEGAQAGLLAHTARVAQAAYAMAVWLGGVGETVDPVLTHRGGLLHDLDKVSSRDTSESHGERSARLLRARGLPELAEIARRHLISQEHATDDRPRTWEEKLVFFADKLVEGDRLVGFTTRLEALKARYPDYAQGMQRGAPYVLALEEEITRHLATTPDGLLVRLQEITQ